MLKIGRARWQLKKVPANNSVLEKCEGMCVYADNTLYVAEALSQQQEDATFCHELTHALLAESGFNHKCHRLFDNYYEEFVDALSKCLADVIDVEVVKHKAEEE